MIDPPRLDVRDSVASCRASGIGVAMITGDHKATALAIARELGIASEERQALSGPEIELLGDSEFAGRVREVRVFARVSPEHKVRIVKAFRANGHIVSMTGDGVNDAPSLKAADIGVAMGITGTDVAKGAADMILADDNFKTMVRAIEEGRNIYANIRKAILYLLSCNAGEIAAVFSAVLVAAPVPLLPIHILWVNLVTDTFPALALGMDPGDPEIIKERPRDPKESLFSRGGAAFIALNGLPVRQQMACLGLRPWCHPPGRGHRHTRPRRLLQGQIPRRRLLGNRGLPVCEPSRSQRARQAGSQTGCQGQAEQGGTGPALNMGGRRYGPARPRRCIVLGVWTQPI